MWGGQGSADGVASGQRPKPLTQPSPHPDRLPDGGYDPVVMGVDAVERLGLGAVARDLALRMPPHLDVAQLRGERPDDLVGMQSIRLPTQPGQRATL